jgi:hypothetical protein
MEHNNLIDAFQLLFRSSERLGRSAKRKSTPFLRNKGEDFLFPVRSAAAIFTSEFRRTGTFVDSRRA